MPSLRRMDGKRLAIIGSLVSRAMSLLRILPALFLLAAAMPQAAAKPHTVSMRMTADQFDHLLPSLRHKRDTEAARAIAAVELTERPSQSQASRWAGEMPGKRSNAALDAAIDAAVLLDPQSEAMPADPMPDVREQTAILARAMEYVKKTLHKLPNFYAIRSAMGFEVATASDLASENFDAEFFHKKDYHDAKLLREDLGLSASIPAGHLYIEGTWQHTVTYRDGSEVEESTKTNGNSPSESLWLTTNGEFGPILSAVLGDAMHGQVRWGHWERNAASRLAVFRYSVPRNASHYMVMALAGHDQELPAYHGEIAIDSDSGTIYRITVQAWTHDPDAAEASGIAVEYDSVTIAGKAYICPVHSVAYWKIYPPYINEDAQPAPIPWREQMNDVRFTQYHVFRSEARILP